jgi:hypothetical protein
VLVLSEGKGADKASSITPTYFWYEVTSIRVVRQALNNPKQQDPSTRLPATTNAGAIIGVIPSAFKVHTLPLFLEGPVRQLKITGSVSERRQIYHAVRSSALYDHKLQMFAISASLAGK